MASSPITPPRIPIPGIPVPCRIPKINIRPQVHPLINSRNALLTPAGNALVLINDVLDKIRGLVCDIDAEPVVFFDKATFGVNGDMEVRNDVTLHYHCGPLITTPVYSTISAKTPPDGADLIIDVKYLPPGLDPQETEKTIEQVTLGSPVEIKITGHGFTTGDRVRLFGVLAALDKVWTVTVLDANRSTLNLSNVTSGAPALGTATRTNWSSVFDTTKLVIPNQANDGSVTWPAAPPSRKVVYQSVFAKPRPVFRRFGDKIGRLRVDGLQIGSITPGADVEINLYLFTVLGSEWPGLPGAETVGVTNP